MCPRTQQIRCLIKHYLNIRTLKEFFFLLPSQLKGLISKPTIQGGKTVIAKILDASNFTVSALLVENIVKIAIVMAVITTWRMKG